MKRLLIIALISALFLTPLVALASDISGAKYWAVIQISNNSTATTNVATTANISTTNLIDGNYLNASANNSVIRTSSGADVPFMPGYTPDGYPWCIWVPSIGDYGYQSDILYTANSTGGLIRYFPGSGGMTTSDNDTLELGDNFTIEQTGWVQTTFASGNYSDRNLVYKQDAFRTYIKGSGNITSAITITPEALRPSGAGDEENINFGTSGGGLHWQDVNDDPINDATLVVENAGYSRDLYQCANTATGSIGTITQVEIFARGHSNGAADSNLKTAIKTGGTAYDGAEETMPSAVWVNYSTVYALDPTDNTSWTWADIDALQIGVSLKRVAADAECSEVWIEVSYQLDVTATGVSSDNLTIKTTQRPVLSFDGVNDKVQIPHDPVLNPTNGDCSIGVWLKNTVGAISRIVDKKQAVTNIGYTLSVRNTGLVDIYFAGTGAYRERYSAGTVNDDIWHLVFVTYTFNNFPDIYIDGVLDNGASFSGGNIDSVTNADDVRLGLDRADGSDYAGLIGEVWFYDWALTVDNITDHYNAVYTDTTGLIGHWMLSEGTGTDAFDSSVENNTGNITGASWGNEMIRIYVDDTLRDVEDGADVPDNSNNWAFIENDSMLYLEDHSISINGTLRQHIIWEYDNVFTDLSGNDNDATPTFRTASSDADVSAELTSFQPIAEAKAPDYVLGLAPDFIDPASTGNFTGTFTTIPAAGAFPLAGVITTIAEATATPPQLPLLIIACFVILAASLSVSAVMRRYGSGSIFVKIIVIAGVMGVFIALQNFAIDFWMTIVFLIISVALAMASRQIGWN